MVKHDRLIGTLAAMLINSCSIVAVTILPLLLKGINMDTDGSGTGTDDTKTGTDNAGTDTGSAWTGT